MKYAILAALFFCIAPSPRAFASDTATLIEADDARIAAMRSGDTARLADLLSDDLHYAHSNGRRDTKASLTDSLVQGRLRYLRYENVARDFTFPAPGVALMTGRARMRLAGDGQEVEVVLGYLAVWRREGDAWRFLAWQSCRLPDVPQP